MSEGKMKFFLIAVGELNPDWESRMIQMGIMAPYSHIAIKVVHENGLVEVFESIGKGIVKSTLDEVLDNGGAVIREAFELVLTVHEERAYGWLLGSLGRGGYSLPQYLGFIFPFMRRFRWIANGRAFSVCSEYGTDFCVDCTGLDHPRIKQADFVSPRTIVEVLQEQRVFGRLPPHDEG